MSGERIGIDDYLAKQDDVPAALRATVKRVSDDADKIKVTPYASDSGCMCHVALVVPKSAISALTSTDVTHNCCGKLLDVVEVVFTEAIMNDVFDQLTRNNTRPSTIDRGAGTGRSVPAAGVPTAMYQRGDARSLPAGWMPRTGLPFAAARQPPPSAAELRRQCRERAYESYDANLQGCAENYTGNREWCECVAANILAIDLGGCGGRAPVPRYCDPLIEFPGPG